MDGILLLNKPILWTSHDAVDFVRRRLRQKSVGHAGSLDPLATGLLVLLVGKATKLSAQLSSMDKDYEGALTLGIETDTQDLEGRILSVREPDPAAEGRLSGEFAALSGEQLQTPPAYSAVREKGRKLYDWARKGIEVRARERAIHIREFSLLRYDRPDAHFFLSCSKGTYVRTLCHEIGRRLGCGATLSALTRTRVGRFKIDDAVSEDDLRRLSPAEIEKRLQ